MPITKRPTNRAPWETSSCQPQTTETRPSPFACLPHYLPPEEMEAVWRVWGWRVLGVEPVAAEDQAAYATVCRQLHTNWGAVYRPVALLPPRPASTESRDAVRLLNQCLAAGWQLRQRGERLTSAALSVLVGSSDADIVPLLPCIHAMLAAADADADAGHDKRHKEPAHANTSK